MGEFNIELLREKPFMERTGAEQEAVRDYWFGHVQEMESSLWCFMGMELSQYESWVSGSLKLNDGSYHEMEPSYFHISQNIANLIRPEIHNEQMLLKGLTFNAFLKGLLPEHPCTGFVSPSCDCAFVFDPGDNLVAAISGSDIMHKEDFAFIMKINGMEATEDNFTKLWPVFLRQKAQNASLVNSVYSAILKQQEHGIEKESRKVSLSQQIQSANLRANEYGGLFSVPAKEAVR